MSSSTAPRLLSYQDLLDTPNDGRRYEIIRGRLVVSASPILKHQKVTIRLADPLYELEKRGVGELYLAPTDVELGPLVIVVPDLVFVRAHRRQILGRQKIEGAPDLIIEILSPSTKGMDEGEKRNLYLRHRVPEYWLIDVERETARAFTLQGSDYVLIPTDEGIVRSLVLPGFEVEAGALFAGLG